MQNYCCWLFVLVVVWVCTKDTRVLKHIPSQEKTLVYVEHSNIVKYVKEGMS